MKFGVREICDVVLKRKAPGYFGKLYLDAGMPVLYFDTLKTSSLEGAATTVYAQGGKGNPRLVAWEGDRTVTFTMEDALISPESFSILSGAGLMDAEDKSIFVHTTQQVEIINGEITLDYEPAAKGEMYIMLMTSDGSINTKKLPMQIPAASMKKVMKMSDIMDAWHTAYTTNERHNELGFTAESVKKIVGVGAPIDDEGKTVEYDYLDGTDPNYQGSVVYVDYYVEATSGVKQIDIDPGQFGGSYYLEASTLFRDQATGEDHPAEFVIPNCKVQSNFTFTMAPSGDPSTFTFTMDAFPDYTKFDKTKKVIAAIQIVEDKDMFGKAAAGGQIV